MSVSAKSQSQTPPPGDADAGLIVAEGLRKRYGEYEALRGLNFRARSGEFVAVMGDSGSGKTTFLNLLAGLDQADAGVLRVAGEEPARLSAAELGEYRRRNTAMVFQDFNLLATLTALENVLMPAWLRGERPDEARARAVLERVGLGDKLGNAPEALSGGEMQRVSIARAVFLQPRLLLADEPTGSLDSRNSREVLALLREVNQEYGLAILMVTHSRSAADAADRIVRMEDGRLAEA